MFVIYLFFYVMPIVFLIWIFCGWYACVVQKRNNYHEKQKRMEEATGSIALPKPITTLTNFMLGPFALMFMAAAPNTKHCLYCKDYIMEKALTCSSCGRSQENNSL